MKQQGENILRIIVDIETLYKIKNIIKDTLKKNNARRVNQKNDIHEREQLRRP